MWLPPFSANQVHSRNILTFYRNLKMTARVELQTIYLPEKRKEK